MKNIMFKMVVTVIELELLYISRLAMYTNISFKLKPICI